MLFRSLIASWYGMNFTTMPELHWKYGYVFVIILTMVTTGLTLFYFRHKKWL